MKTRIISGLVAFGILVALLVANFFCSYVVVAAVCALSAIAAYEMLSRTGAVKNKAVIIIATVFSAAMQLFYNLSTVFTLLYVFAVIAFAVFNHKRFDERQVMLSIAMPIVLSFAFKSLERIINFNALYGLFFFILLLNFACVTDIGAYFVGVKFGKHKLAPELSPKKTIEGAVGGIASAVLGTLIICLVAMFAFDIKANIVIMLMITPVMSAVGMLGDLFASLVKRAYGIKDYGNIMPGHGGVLDRLDSVLLVAPALYLTLSLLGV